MSFTSLGLDPSITDVLETLGYTEPSPIQRKTIPEVLAGRDVLAAAQTGTGKTASFALPILQQLAPKPVVRGKRIQALVLTPTRELALQVASNIEAYAKNLPLSCLALYGGVDSEPQKLALTTGVDIVVATPGRLLDLLHQRALYFDELKFLVLDEADRMLDMGFIEAVNKIIERLPEQRQNLLFSATLSESVRFLAKTAMGNAVEVDVADGVATAPDIKQWLITVDKSEKSALLSHLIQSQQWQQALIFIETKHGAAKLASQLEKRGIVAEAIHSGRSQASREQVLERFKEGELKFLIGTGVAARGLDITELDRVVNYDLPFESDDYIHRIGRTGRAGASGEAVSLVSRDDFKNLCAIESRIGHLIERVEIEGFQPQKDVPVSILNYQPKQTSKQRTPSQPKSERVKQAAKKTSRSSSYKSSGSDSSGGSSKKSTRINPWGV